ncbi:MFS transporter [Saccharomonospora iraqiensis]|uniref:MFS transporter n=1 Tax=Saccharomonospora iraqiensis TaxID=52698 RepID=UPI0003FCDDEF|nr:MFS transporter [Saccharomonospora iraqiensis]
MPSLRDTFSLDELKGTQERSLAISLAVLYLGTGLSYSSLAIYLNLHVGLSPSVYGVGMGVAAVLGLVSGPLAGRLADRREGHRIYLALVWTMGVATLALTVSPAWLALVLLSVLTVCGRGGAAVIGALIGRAVDEERRVRYRAVVRTLSNVAMVAGLGLGALVLAWGSLTAFRVGFVVEAATFLVAGLLVRLAGARLAPAQAPLPTPRPTPEGRSGALRDRRFALLTACHGVLMLPESMLTVALPLWVATQMHAPLWLVSVALVVQTTGTVLLQIPVSRRITDVPAAARAGRRGAALFAAAALLFPVAALADHGPAAVATVLALALVLVGGDVLYAASSWGILYGLAPESSLGQYQGFYNIGFDLSMITGPVLFAWLVDSGMQLGWLGLSALFLLAGLALMPLTARHTAPAPAAAD